MRTGYETWNVLPLTAEDLALENISKIEQKPKAKAFVVCNSISRMAW
jgi:hypothetical protein